MRITNMQINIFHSQINTVFEVDQVEQESISQVDTAIQKEDTFYNIFNHKKQQEIEINSIEQPKNKEDTFKIKSNNKN